MKTAKKAKKDEKKLLLRIPMSAYEAVKAASIDNERSVNSEIEYTLNEIYA
jgi:hypothetical protein